MPHYVKPRTDTQRLALLQQAVTIGRLGDPHTEEPGHLSQATLDKLEAFLPNYTTQLQQIQVGAAQRRTMRQSVLDPRNQVEVQIKTLWNTLRLQVRRQQQPTAIYAFYGLSQQGRFAQPRQPTEWLLLAQQIQAGDDAAGAAGYPSMLNRAQLDAATKALHAALATAATHEARYAHQQRALLLNRDQADQLCKDVVSELRHALRNLAPPQRRQVMRSYGLRFRSAPGEVLDAADPDTVDPDTADPDTEMTGITTPGAAATTLTPAASSRTMPTEPTATAIAPIPTHAAVNGHSDPAVYQPLAL